MSLTPEREAELRALCRQYRIDVLTALLPCSGWERVFPLCHGHQQTILGRQGWRT